MTNLNDYCIFRMTYIDNMPHILQHGITHKTSNNANPNFKSLGDTSIISKRNEFELNNGKKLGDYIPFYFAARMPMLYVIQNGYCGVKQESAEDIVYCVSSVQKIIDNQLDFIFTDGHAIECLTTQYCSDQITKIETLIDWNAVKAKYWKDDNDLDLKRRKQAEFLILGDISIGAVLGYIVFNQNSKQRLINMSISNDKIQIKPDCYFKL